MFKRVGVHSLKFSGDTLGEVCLEAWQRVRNDPHKRTPPNAFPDKCLQMNVTRYCHEPCQCTDMQPLPIWSPFKPQQLYFHETLAKCSNANDANCITTWTPPFVSLHEPFKMYLHVTLPVVLVQEPCQTYCHAKLSQSIPYFEVRSTELKFRPLTGLLAEVQSLCRMPRKLDTSFIISLCAKSKKQAREMRLTQFFARRKYY